MKIGDKVRIISTTSDAFGEIGTVVNILEYYYPYPIIVDIANISPEYPHKEEELEILE